MKIAYYMTTITDASRRAFNPNRRKLFGGVFDQHAALDLVVVTLIQHTNPIQKTILGGVIVALADSQDQTALTV